LSKFADNVVKIAEPPRRPLPVFGRAIALCALASMASLVLATAPLLAADDAPAPKPITPAEAALVTPKQAALMQQQFSALAPQQKGVTDVYAIGVAGWAEQTVFKKELDGALAAIEAVLPLKGKMRLVNHPDTAKTIPLASRQNVAAAVRAVGRIMDKAEDVLILFMTSHGATSGIGLQLPGFAVDFAPAEVAAILKKEGITNRVVIVSACYAGVFVKPLANEDTIVVTAADDKNTSFGCSSERDWTYFGDAFFNHGLKPGADFKTAFDRARMLIQGWEIMDRGSPSNPQGHFGPALVRKLQPLFGTAARAGQ
jgi:hypothetical protein